MNPMNSDTLNGLLILSSALLAWLIPFELFVFSYIVLGPLHYFTEISWLHDKNYFYPSKHLVIPLYVIALLIFISTVLMQQPIAGLVFLAFCLAIVLRVTQNWKIITLTALMIAWPIHIMIDLPLIYWLIVVMLPTIIHVSLFTLIFILYGSHKNQQSRRGKLLILLYLSCVALLIFLPTTAQQLSIKIAESIDAFIPLANQLSQMFNPRQHESSLTPAFRFIAFAYTFHYLNWFVKVNTIKWHKISRTRTTLISIFWLASVLIYTIDLQLGLKVLFILSITHVILEFPLNALSISGLFSAEKTLTTKKLTE